MNGLCKCKIYVVQKMLLEATPNAIPGYHWLGVDHIGSYTHDELHTPVPCEWP